MATATLKKRRSDVKSAEVGVKFILWLWQRFVKIGLP
jgi:hypothetical protein